MSPWDRKELGMAETNAFTFAFSCLGSVVLTTGTPQGSTPPTSFFFFFQIEQASGYQKGKGEEGGKIRSMRITYTNYCT